MSQLVLCEPANLHYETSHHRLMGPAVSGTMTSRSTSSSQGAHTHLSSPPPMLPDDHWNDMEIISFGLHDTHLSACSDNSAGNYQDANTSMIHYAASNNYLELLRKLVITDKTDIDCLDSEGNTPLLVAASVGNSDIAKFLLDYGARVDIQNSYDNSPLHEASWRGYSQTLQILCRYKAKLHLKNRQGHTALHLSAQKGHNQCCRVLLLAGCKPNIKNNFGDTPLHSASRYGHVGVVRILISAFANVNDLNKNDDTSLHIAAAMCRKKLAKILLESGCNPTIINKQGETPMNIALRKSYLDIQELIASPPPLKPVYLKQQELYEKPLQGSYKDIYCAMPKSSESLYYPGTNGEDGEDNWALEEEMYVTKSGHLRNNHHHHHYPRDNIRHSNERHRSNGEGRHHTTQRRSRGCKSDYSNGYLVGAQSVNNLNLRSSEKQSSSVSKYYASMLRKLGGASPLEAEDQEDELLRECSADQRSLSPVKVPQMTAAVNRKFPKPKLETLPSEPLQKGEQYFVDGSGNIHKGRVQPPDMEPLIHHHPSRQNGKKHFKL